MKNVYFIGGIHGVGKGKICTKITAKMNLIHLIASEVLKWEELDENKNKIVKDFKFTQNRLLNNLQRILCNEKTYLLDGHYCLLNSNNLPEKIDKVTFVELNPRALIIVIDKVNKIKSRIEKRDNKKYDLKNLAEFQELELNYSKSLSLELGIPLIIIENGNINNLINFFKNESIT